MSITPPEEMPAEITYGYVMGRYLLAVGDGPDADRLPDGRPATGMTVTFTPAQVMHRVGTPATTVLRAPTPCKVGDDGYIRETDAADATLGDDDPPPPPGVWLITGVYRVTFGGLSSHSIPAAFNIEVTAAHTEAAPLDLTTAAPIIPTPAAPVNALEVTGTPVAGYVVGVDTSGSLVYMPVGGGVPDGGATGQVLTTDPDGDPSWETPTATQTGNTIPRRDGFGRMRAGTPANFADVATKFYVDERSMPYLSNFTALDTVTGDDAIRGFVAVADLGAHTGISSVNGLYSNRMAFESIPTYRNTGPPWGGHWQRVHYADPVTGEPGALLRSRVYGDSGWGAWGAWSVE